MEKATNSLALAICLLPDSPWCLTEPGPRSQEFSSQNPRIWQGNDREHRASYEVKFMVEAALTNAQLAEKTEAVLNAAFRREGVPVENQR
jgi:hypothetical protein